MAVREDGWCHGNSQWQAGVGRGCGLWASGLRAGSRAAGAGEGWDYAAPTPFRGETAI